MHVISEYHASGFNHCHLQPAASQARGEDYWKMMHQGANDVGRNDVINSSTGNNYYHNCSNLPNNFEASTISSVPVQPVPFMYSQSNIQQSHTIGLFAKLAGSRELRRLAVAHVWLLLQLC